MSLTPIFEQGRKPCAFQGCSFVAVGGDATELDAVLMEHTVDAHLEEITQLISRVSDAISSAVAAFADSWRKSAAIESQGRTSS